MRDAIVAATTLDIFNKHCERVPMANIAQTVNVLQAMILTQNEQMLLTPSCHVFEMYAVHQGEGRFLQGATMDAHNTFENPNAVRPQAFGGARVSGDQIDILLPKMSVVALEVS